ncbi:flagellar hook-length control protein FliK [Methylophilus sp. 5]|uniref:flagellar hook-length control protein FliK n=1 Tax=Methylophilus sp. 5 TaxID=1112274 RepID=UPI00048C5E5C|nr:flagellar hook-length control protein FliK [Methylophilus sp. 5]
MAFLNSATLLNMGAEAVKTATANQVSQESQANGSDEFAQALRKQMQQSSKPVMPVANKTMADKAEAPKPAPTAEQSQPAPVKPNSNTPKSEETTQKIAADNNDEHTSPEAAATTEDTAAATAPTNVTDPAAVVETAQERKKRLLADIAANDQLPTGISPWMQTMIAMRPAAAQTDSQPKLEVATDAAAVEGEPLPGIDVNALPLNTEVADKSTAAQTPVGPGVTTDQDDQAADFKQLLAGNPANTGKEAPGLPETLVNAKLMAEATGQTGRSAQGFNDMRSADAQADSVNTIQPAAQALPNSPWLNAAGVAQSSNVVTSQIAAPFGNERWQTAMNQHVMKMVGSGDDVASLTLSPPDLGPIQVVLKVDNQSVNTSFITDNPLVRQALEDGMQDLRDRMQSQGLQLGQTFVGDGQQAQQHFEQQTSRQGGQSSGTAADTESLVAPQAAKTTVARGLVDTFV